LKVEFAKYTQRSNKTSALQADMPPTKKQNGHQN